MNFEKIKGVKTVRPQKENHCSKHGHYVSTNYIGDYWTECPECMTLVKKKKEDEEKLKYIRQEEERIHRRWMAKF